MLTPNWMKTILKKGVILIKGTPDNSDIEDILIKIFDAKGCILRTFILKIQKSIEVHKS